MNGSTRVSRASTAPLRPSTWRALEHQATTIAPTPTAVHRRQHPSVKTAPCQPRRRRAPRPTAAPAGPVVLHHRVAAPGSLGTRNMFLIELEDGSGSFASRTSASATARISVMLSPSRARRRPRCLSRWPAFSTWAAAKATKQPELRDPAERGSCPVLDRGDLLPPVQLRLRRGDDELASMPGQRTSICRQTLSGDAAHPLPIPATPETSSISLTRSGGSSTTSSRRCRPPLRRSRSGTATPLLPVSSCGIARRWLRSRRWRRRSVHIFCAGACIPCRAAHSGRTVCPPGHDAAPEQLPRISGVVPHFRNGELLLAMRTDSSMADDLRREPRCSLHSGPVGGGQLHADAKVPRVEPTRSVMPIGSTPFCAQSAAPAPAGTIALFDLQAVDASTIRLGEGQRHLIDTWHEGEDGVRHTVR